jgi:hypothetical protein
MSNKYRDHIHALAQAFDVHVVETSIAPHEAFAGSGRVFHPHPATADPAERIIVGCERLIVVGRIHEETTYLVALHELGHHLAALGKLHGQRGDPANLRRIEEDAAWEWAKHYALEWTPVMAQVATLARASYDNPPAAKPDPPAPVAPIPIAWEDWK